MVNYSIGRYPPLYILLSQLKPVHILSLNQILKLLYYTTIASQ
jgi:hypothetical protein